MSTSSGSVSLFEDTVPIASAYPPLNSSKIDLELNNEVCDPLSALDVVPGDSLVVDATMTDKDLGAAVVRGTVTGGTLWLKAADGVLLRQLPATVSPGGNVAGSPQHLHATVTITKAVCESIGEDAVGVRIAGESGLGIVPAPAWGGEFQVRCKPPKLELDSDSIYFDPDAVESTSTVQLTHTSLPGRTWLINGPNNSPVPDWLILPTSTGTLPLTGPVAVQVRVDCSKADPKTKVTATPVARATNPPTGYASPTDTLVVTAECRDVFIELDPARQTGTGHVTLRTSGRSLGTWRFTNASLAGAPLWLKLTNGTIGVSR